MRKRTPPELGVRKKIMKLENTQVGVAGEYFVAAELSLRGYLASITLRNTRGIDIIASTNDGKKSVSIQVKTNNNGSATWILNKKSETFHSPNHFYVFVSMRDVTKHPEYYIVPSKDVATFTSESHANWLNGKKKDGSERKDSSMRKFITDSSSGYKDNWKVLFK